MEETIEKNQKETSQKMDENNRRLEENQKETKQAIEENNKKIESIKEDMVQKIEVIVQENAKVKTEIKEMKLQMKDMKTVQKKELEQLEEKFEMALQEDRKEVERRLKQNEKQMAEIELRGVERKEVIIHGTSEAKIQFGGDIRKTHPVPFVKNLKTKLQHVRYFDDCKETIRNHLKEGAALWYESKEDEFENWTDFENKFLNYFWGKNKQREINQELQNGKYHEKMGISEERYALQIYNNSKYLEYKYSTEQLVEMISRHFEETLEDHVILRNYQDIDSLCQFLQLKEAKRREMRNRRQHDQYNGPERRYSSNYDQRNRHPRSTNEYRPRNYNNYNRQQNYDNRNDTQHRTYENHNRNRDAQNPPNRNTNEQRDDRNNQSFQQQNRREMNHVAIGNERQISNSNLIFLDAFIKHKAIKIVIDSGSEISLINKKLVKELNLDRFVYKIPRVDLVGPNNKNLTTVNEGLGVQIREI
ncbi:unnamed protein product [Diabrotica balteata]|uniref:Uncharacterized protein n=1 Tax=Diabrotica balteata TaxID=107213 RepID=A0A9N9SQ16_DIABA|nr:unnamed protein product [Diabrotica balteata]